MPVLQLEGFKVERRLEPKWLVLGASALTLRGLGFRVIKVYRA